MLEEMQQLIKEGRSLNVKNNPKFDSMDVRFKLIQKNILRHLKVRILKDGFQIFFVVNVKN